jgi:biuret amidohydrolase
MNKNSALIVIAGVSINMAVELTAREAHDRDYKAVILSDACASQSKELHDFSIKILSRITEIR